MPFQLFGPKQATRYLETWLPGSLAGIRSNKLEVTNKTSSDQGFNLSADSRFAGPSSMNVKVVLAAGETKYIGIPTSDLTYVTAGSVIRYASHTDGNMVGGQLVIFK